RIASASLLFSGSATASLSTAGATTTGLDGVAATGSATAGFATGTATLALASTGAGATVVSIISGCAAGASVIVSTGSSGITFSRVLADCDEADAGIQPMFCAANNATPSIASTATPTISLNENPREPEGDNFVSEKDAESVLRSGSSTAGASVSSTM